MKRRLPLLTERSLAQVKAERIDIADTFDAKLPQVSCKVGCSACCSYPVYVSILEGMLLFRHLTERGYWTPSFRKKLEQHANQTFDLTSEVWLMLDVSCPLLEKNKCIAYGARPFSCRTLYARSDPKNCHPHRITSARYVEREETIAKFRQAEAKILARHKLALLGMPISKAVLLAERILNGEYDLENFLRLALENFKEASP